MRKSITGIKSFLQIRLRVVFVLSFLSVLAMSRAQGPATPETDSISITSNGHPLITWFPNSDNAIGYVIVQRQGLIWQRIDTLTGIQETAYTDLATNACTAPQWYRVYAYAGPNIPDSPWSDTLRTIYLATPQLDVCSNVITLRWTHYINMRPQLAGYHILASKNGGPYSIIGTVGTTDTSFVHQNPAPGTLYTYKIRAFNTGETRTSTSCERAIRSKTYNKPQFAYIRYASVEDDAHIKVEWVADTAPISRYSILRSIDGQNFAELGQNSDETNYRPAQVFIDTSADFRKQSYFYRIDVFDSCGFKLLTAENTARSILLSGRPNSNYQNELSWNAYEGWDLGVDEYRIFRKVNGTPDPAGPLTTLPAGTTSWSDDVSMLENTGGTFNYTVVAYETAGDNGFEAIRDSSVSNEIIITQETRVLVPNAFMPGGMPPDNVFKPLTAFIEQDGYEMLIYNKWGQQIFSTTDPADGWDGRYNGEFVPPDAYVYLIRYKTPEGQLFEKRGTVTVVR